MGTYAELEQRLDQLAAVVFSIPDIEVFNSATKDRITAAKCLDPHEFFSEPESEVTPQKPRIPGSVHKDVFTGSPVQLLFDIYDSTRDAEVQTDMIQAENELELVPSPIHDSAGQAKIPQTEKSCLSDEFSPEVEAKIDGIISMLSAVRVDN